MTAKRKKKEFAVVGLGLFGSSVALALAEHGQYVLGIDNEPDLVQKMADHLAQTACLDATDQKALDAVDIGSFDTVIIGIGTNFENNLMATVAMKNLGAPHIICKASSRQQESILLKVGADQALLPESESGKRLANELVIPWLTDQIPLGSDHSISEICVPPSLIGITLVESGIRQKYGVTILVVKNDDRFLVSPPANYQFLPGDLLVIVGDNQDINRFSLVS
jgi:trk system potassium uptake protein